MATRTARSMTSMGIAMRPTCRRPRHIHRYVIFVDATTMFPDRPPISMRPADPRGSRVRIACLVAVLTTLTAVGQQDGGGVGGVGAPGRVPGFEIPRPPKAPDFPELPGLVDGVPGESPGDERTDAAVESESRLPMPPVRRVSLPPRRASWDQSSEFAALKGSPPGGSAGGLSLPKLPVRDLAIVAALATATAIAGGIAYRASSRRTDTPPVPIVRSRQPTPRDR